MDKLILLTILLIIGQSCQEIIPPKNNSNKSNLLTPIKAKNTLNKQTILKIIKEQKRKKDAIALEKHIAQYNHLKDNIKTEIKAIKALRLPYKQKLDSLKKHRFTMLVDSIFPYWYETKWAFHGYTTTPRKGKIACGYFVTTTLRDVGVQLQRIKLAQQAASGIIEKLCVKNSIKRYTKLSSLQAYMDKAKNNSIFILGLDKHVGFVIKQDHKSYFIHSGYVGQKKVARERLEKSYCVLYSNILMIGQLK